MHSIPSMPRLLLVLALALAAAGAGWYFWQPAPEVAVDGPSFTLFVFPDAHHRQKFARLGPFPTLDEARSKAAHYMEQYSSGDYVIAETRDASPDTPEGISQPLR